MTNELYLNTFDFRRVVQKEFCILIFFFLKNIALATFLLQVVYHFHDLCPQGTQMKDVDFDDLCKSYLLVQLMTFPIISLMLYTSAIPFCADSIDH